MMPQSGSVDLKWHTSQNYGYEITGRQCVIEEVKSFSALCDE
jgi:hypothetical protein